MNSKILRRILGGAAALAITATFCSIERYMTVAAAEEEPPYVKESYDIDFTNYKPMVAYDQWGKTAGSWSFAQKIQWKKLDDGTVEQYKRFRQRTLTANWLLERRRIMHAPSVKSCLMKTKRRRPPMT